MLSLIAALAALAFYLLTLTFAPTVRGRGAPTLSSSTPKHSRTTIHPLLHHHFSLPAYLHTQLLLPSPLAAYQHPYPPLLEL